MRKQLFLIGLFAVATLNILYADLIINGNGNKLTLTETSSIVVPTASKVTLRNITVEGVQGTRLIMEHETSKLILDDATLMLSGEYSFSQGSMEIVDNSGIEGEYTFTFKGHNLLIRNSARLTIDNNTSFVLTPSSGIRTPVRFEDETSTFALNNATLKNYNYATTDGATGSQGIIFTNGRFEIDGTSLLESVGTLTDTALVLGTGQPEIADCRFVIKPDAKLRIQQAGIVYQNHGANSFNNSGNKGSIKSETNGRFVVAPYSYGDTHGATYPIASLGIEGFNGFSVIGTNSFSLNNNSIDVNTNTLSGLDGSGTVTGMQALAAVRSDLAGGCNSVDWSPDSKYLLIAAGNSGAGETFEIVIDSFDGATLTEIAGVEIGDSCHEVAWSPNGKYFAAVNNAAAVTREELIVYSFLNEYSGASVTLSDELDLGVTASSCHWSPDGRFIAIGKTTGGSDADEFIVYRFDPSLALGSRIVKIDGVSFPSEVRSVRFNPDGKHIAIGTNLISSGADQTEVRIYSFDEAALTQLGSGIEIGDNVNQVAWSPGGQYLAVAAQNGGAIQELSVYRFDENGVPVLTPIASADLTRSAQCVTWSPDGMCITVGRDSDASTAEEVINYAFDGTSLTALPSSIDLAENGDDDPQAIAWSHDGQYLAIGIRAGGGTDELEIYPAARGITVPKRLELTGGTMNVIQDMLIQNLRVTIH